MASVGADQSNEIKPSKHSKGSQLPLIVTLLLLILGIAGFAWYYFDSAGQITDLNGQVSDLASTRDSLQGQVASLQGQASSLQTQLNSADSRASSLQSQLNSANSDLGYKRVISEIVYVNLPGPSEPSAGMTGGELLHGFLSDVFSATDDSIRNNVNNLSRKWNVRFRRAQP